MVEMENPRKLELPQSFFKDFLLVYLKRGLSLGNLLAQRDLEEIFEPSTYGCNELPDEALEDYEHGRFLQGFHSAETSYDVISSGWKSQYSLIFTVPNLHRIRDSDVLRESAKGAGEFYSFGPEVYWIFDSLPPLEEFCDAVHTASSGWHFLYAVVDHDLGIDRLDRSEFLLSELEEIASAVKLFVVEAWDAEGYVYVAKRGGQR